MSKSVQLCIRVLTNSFRQSFFPRILFTRWLKFPAFRP